MAGNRRIAILGAGKIGESLLAGLLSSGWRKPGDIVVTGRREERMQEVAERHGVEATLSSTTRATAVAASVLAVYSPSFVACLRAKGAAFTRPHRLTTWAAGRPQTR